MGIKKKLRETTKHFYLKLSKDWEVLDFISLFGSLQNIYNYYFIMEEIIEVLNHNEKHDLRRYRTIMNVMNGFYFYTQLIRHDDAMDKPNPLVNYSISPFTFNKEVRKQVWSFHQPLKVDMLKRGTRDIIRISGIEDAIYYMIDLLKRVIEIKPQSLNTRPNKLEGNFNITAEKLFDLKIDLELLAAMKRRGYTSAEVKSIKKYEIFNAEQILNLIVTGKVTKLMN